MWTLYFWLLYIPQYACMCPKFLQSCLTLSNTMDCSPPGSSVHGILQARILEWVVMPSSGWSSQPRDQTCISYFLHWQVSSLPLAPPQYTYQEKLFPFITAQLTSFNHFALPPTITLLITTTLFSVSVCFFVWFIHLFCVVFLLVFLYYTYKWNPTVFVFFHLTYFV